MTILKELASAGSFALLGVLLGQLEFAGLRKNVAAYVASGVRARTVAWHGLRLLLVALGFVALAHFGAAALLAAFAGLLIARAIELGRIRRQT